MGDRIDVTCELIDTSLSKTIVFVPYRHVCDRVERELRAKGYGVAVVHGGVTGNKRDSAIQKFQLDAGTQVLVAHPRTASHGLNLQCASTTIWYGPTFSTESWLQANERMSRTGQPHKMIIARLSSMAVETGAYETVATNDDRQQRILKLYEEVLK
jgi:SNF2 family DNA or RNA helicase